MTRFGKVFLGACIVLLAWLLIKYPEVRAELFGWDDLVAMAVIVGIVTVVVLLYAWWVERHPEKEVSVCPTCGQEVPPEKRRLLASQMRGAKASSSQTEAPP